ncbi:MAG: hypothetical protein JWP02_1924, partial [Acidimicrobiales bacterium]|nr:hypothetical protein [Acidimicrobiales bacterium]
MRRRAATSAAILGSGLVLLAGLGGRLAPARADAPTLGSYSMSASAPGYEFTEDEPAAQSHPEGQGSVPWTTTVLANGGIGYGLSTVAWPGNYGGNVGNLLLVATPSQVPGAGVPVPDAVHQVEVQAGPTLQYPIRAEAHAGSSPDASFNSAPGTNLTAHADDQRVQADASLQSVNQQGMGTFGNIHSFSSSTLTNNAGVALATSVVHDVDFAKVIKIKSVTSTATARTDGATADATGGTVVEGMTIGGQPAYVDDTGVHIGSQGQPANATADQIAAQVLGGAGVTTYTSRPQRNVNGASANYTAGSLIVVWMPPSNPSKNVFIMTLGGARVAAAAAPGSDYSTSSDTGTAGDTGVAADVGGGTAAVPG